jgi:CHAD domain-containing protein
MKHAKVKWQPEAPAVEEAARALPRIARAYLRSGRKAAHKSGSASELHEFRLVTKHFRYLLELFGPLYGARLEPYFTKLKRIQKLLGELNDYAVTREMMDNERGKDRDQLLAHLDKQQKRRLKQFIKYWDTNFDSGEQKQAWVEALRIQH